ncbi:universal stress protein [Deinococcus rubellus]|uniref:universal stress protein n=1 Tax=Deinococcus rubellus TaxID=1889240 RepID=UPI0031E957B9
MFDHLLVTTDGSPLGNRALPIAADVARTYGSKLTLVYVMPPVAVSMMYAQGGYGFDAEAERKQLVDEAERILAEGLKVIDYPGARSVRLEPGVFQVALAIAGEVERLNAKLVVMGTHGRSGLAHFFLGSVAEEVLRSVKVPVLFVPRQASVATHPAPQEARA